MLYSLIFCIKTAIIESPFFLQVMNNLNVLGPPVPKLDIDKVHFFLLVAAN